MAEFDLVFCDTCVGGSTVAARLAASRSGLTAYYLADYGINPLGVKPRDEVRAVLRRWVARAGGLGGTLVIACNTASGLYRDCPEVQGEAAAAGLRVFSMVDFLERQLAAEPGRLAGRRVCLMGTRFTVSQPVYADLLRGAGAAQVVPLPATRTEGVIAHLRHGTEAGRREIAAEIGETVRGCDAVILACTLFPLIGELIRALSPGCDLLDPGAGVTALLPPGAAPGPNRITVALTGSAFTPAEIRRSAGALFPGWELVEVIPGA